jgi:hypothetical protein
VSAELRRLIEGQMEQLRRLEAEHREGIEVIMASSPDLWQREALGTMLHSFYTGIESVMRSIAMMSPEGFAKGPSWHTELLEAMQSPAPGRGPVLSRELARTLKDFLEFRHRFRNLYGFELEWERMRPLVERLGPTLALFEASVRSFLDSLPAGQ